MIQVHRCIFGDEWTLKIQIQMKSWWQMITKSWYKINWKRKSRLERSNWNCWNQECATCFQSINVFIIYWSHIFKDQMWCLLDRGKNKNETRMPVHFLCRDLRRFYFVLLYMILLANLRNIRNICTYNHQLHCILIMDTDEFSISFSSKQQIK